jgi:hypothetical protein
MDFVLAWFVKSAQLVSETTKKTAKVLDFAEWSGNCVQLPKTLAFWPFPIVKRFLH